MHGRIDQSHDIKGLLLGPCGDMASVLCVVICLGHSTLESPRAILCDYPSCRDGKKLQLGPCGDMASVLCVVICGGHNTLESPSGGNKVPTGSCDRFDPRISAYIRR